MEDLFDDASSQTIEVEEDILWLKRFCHPSTLASVISQIAVQAPWRHMATKSGRQINVAMTNCGRLGWVSDRQGYYYSELDPQSGKRWPGMPDVFRDLAQSAAQIAGFEDFDPDACLMNRYQPGQGMGAHQDRNERDLSQPIVSVSLGLSARFFLKGLDNRGKASSIDLSSGDVMVWGRGARLVYHGVRPLKPGVDPVFGECRINLTFRRAG